MLTDLLALLAAPTNVGAFLFASVLATTIAGWGIITQRAIARRRATLDLILRSQSDEDLIKARTRFVALSRQSGGLAPWAEKDKEGESDIQDIILVLNEFEIISIGIQRGIIDYKLFERWYKTSTVQFWKAGRPFILKLRERVGNDMLFYEFEEMVRWFEGSKKPKRRRFLGKWF